MPLRSRSLVTLAVVVGCTQPGQAPPRIYTESQGEVALRPVTRVGPSRGALVVVGGGQVVPEIVGRFLTLAGGRDAPIVVIPTAGGEPDSLYGPRCTCLNLFWKAGASRVVVLHTYDRRVADSEDFVRAIRTARGVWFTGGRQWRLADVYLGTRTERALDELLQRGGVIGGSSAGASIQASFLMRGAPEGNTIPMSPGHEQGFAFLRNVAVDQHVLVRNRLEDLPTVLEAHPGLLGIGIDERTAIVVQGDEFEVVGRSRAFVYGGNDLPDPGKPFLTLRAGDRYDMAARRLIARDK